MQKIASQIADRVWIKLAEDVDPTTGQRILAQMGGPLAGAYMAPEEKGLRTFGHMYGKGTLGVAQHP